ncbi:(2Fe-2S)-binding protein [Allorhizobium taibaishanense]|uniref:(2Fe-2S)-binding protein n=1 Tax=Allorhizobium taibaishanense TaxID=887144 RepID=A0A1Q9AA33_9HYPH|nr:(2Fe-2S)-binding protein [Allorhizobium taibaishanense]MBB4010084.1 carbon-monoxide dehydrogenase small subunit [Allorhizobium taibaishanense]OLP51687.1 (2Fe-2S)-binding protein [Allorhizobium taibaishanense]
MTVSLRINGSSYRFSGDPMTPLVDVLRSERFLTGTKAVCREGFCGACTVDIDGQAVMSCLRPIGLLDGAIVNSIESMATGDGPLHSLQAAFLAADVVQCGMCFPGMIMSLSPFLRENPSATRTEVKAAMVGNICRCTGYERIIDAIMDFLAMPKEGPVHG